jgi:uncharacterized membrane protein
MHQLPKYFFRGLLTLIPVVVTAYVFWVVFAALDEWVFQHLGRLISRLAWGETPPEPSIIGRVLGVAGAITLITLVGAFASNFIGRRLVAMMEGLVEKLPLIKLLYGSVRDVLGALVGDKKSFDNPVVVALGDDDRAKVLGFVTRDSLDFLGVEDHVAVYLPQSYNFAGNVLLFPKDKVRPLAASSSDVMTFLVSGGVSGR